jgi:predicted transcriptional regulator
MTTGMVRQIRDLSAAGVVQKRIAAMVGVCDNTVSKYARGLTDARLQERARVIAELWPQTSISTRELGRRFGVTGAAISQHAKRIGLPPRRNYNPSSRKD